MSALSGVMFRVIAMATVTAGFTWAPAQKIMHGLTTTLIGEAMR
jgi:hypothetical protein